MKNKLDPRLLSDWQIAEESEKNIIPISILAEKIGLLMDEIIPMGSNLAKIDYQKVLKRLEKKKQGKYVIVTAITPTTLGEGKTTTTIGLIQGLGKINKRVIGAIRQPSSGPTFNIKGSAAGGGLSQCIPLAPFSIRLTGDIDSITNAHNLAMVALTARLQHESNYDDEKLLTKHLKRLNIDPKRIEWKWAIDFCAQALRNITIGKGGIMDGVEMDSGFQISVSSELMSILSISQDLKDMRNRISKIVLAYDKNGKEITTKDIEVDGAMAAWLVDTINPNLLQTIESQPILVHAGPFANIAIGQSSIIADKLGLKLADYHITECGFGSDIGYEKFWNIKCRISGLEPDAVVLVATIKALKTHGSSEKTDKKLKDHSSLNNLALLEKGCANLIAHIEIIKKSGIIPIVCLNIFSTDTTDEIKLVCKIIQSFGITIVPSYYWLNGGDGAIELAKAVVNACERKNNFKLLYNSSTQLRKKIEMIAINIYGADGIEYEPKALEKIKILENQKEFADFDVCMVKTHLSLSHDPSKKGRPHSWKLPIQDILIYKGARFIVPVAGNIKLIPGKGSNPAFRRIDIDTTTGKIKGLY